MKIRRLSAVVWGTSIAVVILLVYIVTDLRIKLRNIKYALEGIDKAKWLALESKVSRIESVLNNHYNTVSNTKPVIDLSVAKWQEQYPPQSRVKNMGNLIPTQRPSQPAGNEAPKEDIQFNSLSCPIQKQTIPKTDIQMLSMYDKMSFDEIIVREKLGWNIEYKEDQWNQKNKLKVFLVPHSHNDPGWLKTFEKYYYKQTRAIFSNMVEELPKGKNRKFVWAEISFLALWWKSDANDNEKDVFLKLLKNKTIEIVTGGWVMNDEACSHWISIIQQLTIGHQWCLDNLGIIPKNAWSIDPFGYSSSQPYLLKLAGFENSVIHRVHHAVKKELASNRQLEFRWRQLWDGVGNTDIFTHMFPFVSYGVPHSCGPDPGICCQFDFKRLTNNGLLCQWGDPPKKIASYNVQSRASLILDQWRKKAQLYRSNVVLIPLGDDFAYDRPKDWYYQFENYEMLIDYINNNNTLNTEVQFGNLEDYFEALHTEVNMSAFPVLSGDFFTYADEPQHYWSGYFTSRPFYKNMDRVLLSYVRAAETISAQAMSSRSLSHTILLSLRNHVDRAKQALALFQHHDAITGTSRDKVKKDYAKKIQTAIINCQSVIKVATYYMLNHSPILDQIRDFINFDEYWRRYDEIPSRTTLTLDVVLPPIKIVLYNALAFTRHEILSVIVSSPYVEVYDPSGNPIMAQVSPVVVGERNLTLAEDKYQLSFPVVVNSLALTTYTVVLSNRKNLNKYTTFSRVRMYNMKDTTVNLPKIFPVEKQTSPLLTDIIIQSGNDTKIVATMKGLIKAIISSNETSVPVRMDFIQYDSDSGIGSNSGAYLFMPWGPAEPFRSRPFPEIVVIEGIYIATLYTALISPNVADVVVAISIINNPSLQQSEVEITNTLLINEQVENLELAMRFSTDIKNGDVFYTDANGMQMIKRRHFEKLPIQANFYPLSAAAYIEDHRLRLTLLTSTPLGLAALLSGQMEVMQDRRLLRDDSRGLGQGILDNVRTLHTFKLIVEKANDPCPLKTPMEHPSGQLTLGAHVSQQFLLQPLIVMHYTARNDSLASEYTRVTLNSSDVVLAAYQSHVVIKDKNGSLFRGKGVTFQRVYLEPCYGNKEINEWYQLSDGQVELSKLVDAPADSVHESTLTFNSLKNQLPNSVITLCPQEIRSVFINDTLKTN